MEITPELCPCLQANPELAYAGIDLDGTPYLLCPACATLRIAELLEDHAPADVANLVHAETQHLEALTLAMHNARIALRETDSRISNRLNTCKQHIWRLTRGPKQEPFVRQPYGVSDGIPSYQRRLKHYERVKEGNSLSAFSGVEAFSRTVTYA